MASTLTPTASQSSEDSDLITALHVLSAKSPKLVRSSVYSAPSDPSIQVRSWKMNEFKYYDVPSPFPTLARGLFTREIPSGEDGDADEGKGKRKEVGKRHQIVVRGYDKFFNIGEVPWTDWDSLEAHTGAPYTLSLKSNGCIIFIAALTPTKLIITSKHSLGPVAGNEISHAQAGEAWLKRYLVNKGKTEEDLAKKLWESNLTAIAELCDDSFEEHVLAYPPEKTGLHLHGLNVRSKEFKTLSTDLVDTFADEWGFIKTPTIVLNTIQEVRDFSNTCAETGEWNGEPVEGFVVRTHVTEPLKSKRVKTAASPYPPGSSFFFKIKFEEPYLMYRDWREVTKMLLTAKGPMSSSILPKSKMKRPETKLYVKWVIQEITNDRESFKNYSRGKGIIATRDKFLEYLKTKEGTEAMASSKDGKDGEAVAAATADTKKFSKTIIVPVAVPGCGKTSVSLALAQIFGFGHTQSDDIHVKKPGPVFVKRVFNLLDKYDVVIADKNNHLKQHRQALRDAASKYRQPVRLLALEWLLDPPPATTHRLCADRVLQRGENHQTLRADASTKFHEQVIWMFINSTEGLSPSEVDNVVEMNIEESMDASVRRAVEGVVEVLGLDMPSDEKIREALDMVQGYAPGTKKPDGPKEKQEVRYYGLLPEVYLGEYLDQNFGWQNREEEFWNHLKTNRRVTNRPHVTIVHRNSIDRERELWDRCTVLDEMSSDIPFFTAKLTNLVWNDRVMAVTVDNFDLDRSDGDAGAGGQEGAEFVSKLSHDVRETLHITVGTRKDGIPAVEARTMIQEWREGKNRNKIKSMKLGGLLVFGRIKGLTN